MNIPFSIQPPPLRVNYDQKAWSDWFRELQYRLTNSFIGWSSIDFSGSDLIDIETRNHNDLQTIDGDGTYHLTSGEYSELQRGNNVTAVAVDTSLDDSYRTVYVTATGKTITLPAASSDRIGKDWTIILANNGYTTISRAGSDTINLPTNDTSIMLRTKGASVTLKCLSATSWGIV